MAKFACPCGQKTMMTLKVDGYLRGGNLRDKDKYECSRCRSVLSKDWDIFKKLVHKEWPTEMPTAGVVSLMGAVIHDLSKQVALLSKGTKSEPKPAPKSVTTRKKKAKVIKPVKKVTKKT